MTYNKTKGGCMKIKNIGIKIAETVASFIGSWNFISFYIFSTLAWIFLHYFKIIKIDDPSFLKFNLFLAIFTVTQGSLLLIAANKQDERDREKLNQQYEQTEKRDQEQLALSRMNALKIFELTDQIGKLEEALDNVLQENEDEPN